LRGDPLKKRIWLRPPLLISFKLADLKLVVEQPFSSLYFRRNILLPSTLFFWNQAKTHSRLAGMLPRIQRFSNRPDFHDCHAAARTYAEKSLQPGKMSLFCALVEGFIRGGSECNIAVGPQE
jgi:hypothetical protein